MKFHGSFPYSSDFRAIAQNIILNTISLPVYFIFEIAYAAIQRILSYKLSFVEPSTRLETLSFE